MNDKPPVTMMHESWEPPPELAGPTPRRFRWKQVGILIPAMVVFIFLVGLGILGATWHAADESNRLGKEGQITDATVTRTWTDGASYKVAYVYNIEINIRIDGLYEGITPLDESRLESPSLPRYHKG